MIFSGGRSVRAPGGGARRRGGMNCCFQLFGIYRDDEVVGEVRVEARR